MFIPKFTTLCIFLAISAYYNFEIHQIDIVMEFLNSNLNKETFIKVSDNVQQFVSSESFRKS